MSYKSFLPRFGGSQKEESANVTQTKRKQVMWVVGLLMLAMVALYGTYSSFPSILTDESSSRASTILATEDEHPKHIVMIVADDMGYVDMTDLPHKYSTITPNMDKLMEGGVRMTRHYSMHLCTPARSPWGLPTIQETLPNRLKEVDYQNHLVGKWHLGHHSSDFLPHNRGFDTALGFMTGMEFYYSRKHTLKFQDQLWYDNYYAESEDWSGEDGGTFEVTDVQDGVYGPQIHLERAQELIDDHDTSLPLFLFYSAQNVHAPLDNPPPDVITEDMDEFIHDYSNNTFEQSYLSSMVWLDYQIGELMGALEGKGIIEDTLIVFISDNGGCPVGGGFNTPLRGGKGSLFEGGVKTNAFIWSNYLPEEVQGTTYDNLMHVSDWMPTLLSYAGADYHDLVMDGSDHWLQIMGLDTNSPRTEVLLNIDTFDGENVTERSRAIIVGDYKLMYDYKQPHFEPANTAAFDTQTSDYDPLDCSTGTDGVFHKFVFDLKNDPYETENMIDSINSYLLLYMDSRLQSYSASSTISCYSPTDTSEDLINAWEEFGDYIGPWEKGDDMDCVKAMVPDIGEGGDVDPPLDD